MASWTPSPPVIPVRLKKNKTSEEGMAKMSTHRLSVSINEETNKPAMQLFFPRKEAYEFEFLMENEKVDQEEANRRLDVFVEHCSCLYRDILDVMDEDVDDSSSSSTETAISSCELSKRENVLIEEGKELSHLLPGLDTIISLRLASVHHAMIQFKSRPNCTVSEQNGGVSALTALRRWLQSTDDRLREIDGALSENIWEDISALRRLATKQQVIQLGIESEGQTLVQTLQRENSRLDSVDKKGVDKSSSSLLLRSSLEERRDRALRSLTQRWHVIWLRSLSLQCRIEQAVEQCSQQNGEDDTIDPDLAEPSAKRRRLSSSKGELKAENEEDTIPFSADEYESIMNGDEESDAEYRNGNGRLVFDRYAMAGSPGAIEELRLTMGQGPWELVSQDIGYSSGENSVHEALNDLGMPNVAKNLPAPTREDQDFLPPSTRKDQDFLPPSTRKDQDFLPPSTGEDPDWLRRLRIHSSPVKSFYRTVALDDAGVTEMDNPIPFARSWSQVESAIIADPLSDSLIVQIGADAPLNDVESVLAVFDELDGGMKVDHHSAIGTTWHEICANNNGNRAMKISQELEDFDQQNSCDASSEESEDHSQVESDSAQICAQPTSLRLLPPPPPPGESNSSSLKRRHRVRPTHRPASFCAQLKSSLTAIDLNQSLCASEMEFCLGGKTTPMTRSLCLPQTPPSRVTRERRRLRARRMPRSMSDGEHLCFNVTACNGHSLKVPRPGIIESDTTAPETNEVTSWEWDDYHPPAKHEGDGDNTLNLDENALNSHFGASDDYQALLSGQESGDCLSSLLFELHAALRTARFFLDTQRSIDLPRKILNDLVVGAKANILRLRRAGLLADQKETTTLNEMEHQWLQVLAMANSLILCPIPVDCLSVLQSKIERFARSLQHIHEQCCTARVPLIATSHIDDALSLFRDIQERLLEERCELLDVLKNTSLDDHRDIVEDLHLISMGYDESLEKCAQQMQMLKTIGNGLNQWNESRCTVDRQLEELENKMSELENGNPTEKKFQNHVKMIWAELQTCDERMARLETVCNYLVQSITSLQDGSDSVDNITAQFEDCSRSLSRLRMRFEQLTTEEANSTPRHYHDKSSPRGFVRLVWKTIAHSSSVQILLMLVLLAGLAAWLCSEDSQGTNNWRYAWGPQLEYVRGAPPT